MLGAVAFTQLHRVCKVIGRNRFLSFNILMSCGTFVHISYVALITHYNSNVHFIFNYNAYKASQWTVNYYTVTSEGIMNIS